jgi:hypothetical protein
MRKDSCLYVVAVVAVAVTVAVAVAVTVTVAVAVTVAETDAYHGGVGCDLASVTCIIV